MDHAICKSNSLGRASIAQLKYGLRVRYPGHREYHATRHRWNPSLEPRLEDHGRVIHDEYSIIRDHYGLLLPEFAFRNITNSQSDAPKYPVVLAHGLLGFDELRLGGRYLPGVQYWRGIKEALTARGIEVITATVPPSGSIEDRAKELELDIEAGARGKDVNIIAYVA